MKQIISDFDYDASLDLIINELTIVTIGELPSNESNLKCKPEGRQENVSKIAFILLLSY